MQRARRPVRAARQNAAGNPYDGHTLGVVIEDTERLTGCEIEHAYVDKGYRGHRAANPCRVFISAKSTASSASPSANCDAAAPSRP
jgi:hypothetical protein